jgi:hypothetical protein
LWNALSRNNCLLPLLPINRNGKMVTVFSFICSVSVAWFQCSSYQAHDPKEYYYVTCVFICLYFIACCVSQLLLRWWCICTALPNVMGVIEQKRVRWVWHVACMGEVRNSHKVLIIKPEGKRQLWRPWHTWKGSVKMDFQDIGCNDS